MNKRAKLDSYVTINIMQACRLMDVSRTSHAAEVSKLQPLTLLAEVLGTTNVPGSLDLVSTLLETLNKIVRSDHWGPSDTNYVCQMLIAAIEKSASRVMVRISLVGPPSLLNKTLGTPCASHSLRCFGRADPRSANLYLSHLHVLSSLYSD